MTPKQAKNQLDKYKRLYRVTGEANKRFERTITDLIGHNKTLGANLINAQNAVDLNKILLRQMMEDHNQKQHDLIALLTSLKAKLREMGYDGDFDNLGN